MTEPIMTTESVWDSFMQGFMQLFEIILSNPYTILALLGLITIIIISIVANLAVKYFSTRYWTKVRERARLEEREKYKSEKANKKK